MIHSKTQVLFVFLQYESLIELQFQAKIKMLQSDGRNELKKLESHLSNSSILRRISFLYTPSQNGVVKRRNKQVVKVSLAIIMRSNVPMSYWDFGFQIFVYLIKHLPS